MELNKNDINDIKAIMQRYKNRDVDKKFVINILEILNSYLDHEIKLIINKSKNEPYVNMDEGIMVININELNDLSKRFSHKAFLDYEENRKELYNYYSLVTLFHEFTHLEQYYIINDVIDERLAKIYHDIINGNFIAEIMYKLKGPSFCHERNANITAFREALSIVDNEDIYDYFKCLYLYTLANNYSNKGLTPVKHTYNMILKKYNINSEGMEFHNRIMHGLDLTKEEYDNLFIDFDGKKSYKDMDEKRIIKLTRK